MAKRKINKREPSADVTQGRPLTGGAQNRSFRGGDLILVLMVIGLTALVIVVSAVLVPTLRNQFLEKYEDLTFTVELPSSIARDADILPKMGDSWFLLDSDGAQCVVTDVVISDENESCYVTLKREKACYREGEGYTIAATRIAVGTTLYFRCDPDLYFAATVKGISTERFPTDAGPAESEKSGEELNESVADAVTEAITVSADVADETTEPNEVTETSAEPNSAPIEQEPELTAERGEEETDAETK